MSWSGRKEVIAMAKACKLTKEERGWLAELDDHTLRLIEAGKLDFDWVRRQKERTIKGKEVDPAQKMEVGLPAKPGPKPILEVVQTIEFPGTEQEQSADELFAVGSQIDNGQTIGWRSNDWNKNFSGMKIPPPPASTLTIQRLTKSATDGPIVKELGGETTAVISLAEFHHSLKVNGWIFAYVKNKHGKVVAAGARWDVGDRHLLVYPLDDDPWSADNQVVSRNCCGFSSGNGGVFI